MEAFYTIQGEGNFQGHAAYFIRLAGCDVGCVWCDVKESWDESIHPKITLDKIVNDASKHKGRLAVVTGGEPLMHNLDDLTALLHQNGFQTNIETSGVCKDVSGNWDWICFSPKKFKKPNPAIFPLANELKVVVYHPSDIEWAETFVPELQPNCKLYLQPEWSKMDEILPSLVEYVKENPQWNISLQTHKFMNIP
ncbi:MAG: 7-carboxy-7-deazaguanine synthase QueE [Pseudarcicella sp.]|nr:7-carboxy-7-deazaguanine synthase QueE [Pseudarcicella sp.]MBP6411149.1 7-carboxy-7-deazaguanine synthase QueE [Pseudarcicella sp.]